MSRKTGPSAGAAAAAQRDSSPQGAANYWVSLTAKLAEETQEFSYIHGDMGK